MENKKTTFGADLFLQQANKFKDMRFGLVTNNAATTSTGESSSTALLRSGFKIIKLFSPEHGLTAQGEDGSYQKNIIDPSTKLSVISLYGENLSPTEKNFEDIDAILCDIPDVGCRFYTYLWTMTYVMEACEKSNKQLIILDRPNPVSGNIDLIEGPMMDEKNCSSFIGRWNIPVRHSCTLGELANYFSKTRIKNIDLQIIKVKNWDRNKISKKVDWYFVSPSPAITDVETALLYPGIGLLEGINVNEGRGTETPFKTFGAPWINAPELKEEFLSLTIHGMNAETISYKPNSGMYADEICHGLKLDVTDAEKFKPVQFGLHLLKLIKTIYPDECKERLYVTRANPSGKDHLDKLTGVHHSFEKITTGELLEASNDTEWQKTIQPFLFY